MDMIIKAISLAQDGIASADRSELDRITTHSAILDSAISTAEQIGCESDDITQAREHLAELAKQCRQRQRMLSDNVLATIREHARNGLDARALFPCTTGEALRDALVSAVSRIEAAGRRGAPITMTIGHREPVAITPSSLSVGSQSLHVGDREWLLREIAAVSQKDGLGLVVHSTLIRVDCPEANPGMSVADVRALLPGTKVVLLEETSGESADGEERTYPVGTLGEVSQVKTLPEPQGLSITVIIGPQDGDEAIVNVFDEGDAWFPIALGDDVAPSTSVEEAFMRLCEELDIPATAAAYLEVPRILAAARGV